jgi:hypothetical protein
MDKDLAVQFITDLMLSSWPGENAPILQFRSPWSECTVDEVIQALEVEIRRLEDEQRELHDKLSRLSMTTSLLSALRAHKLLA